MTEERDVRINRQRKMEEWLDSSEGYTNSFRRDNSAVELHEKYDGIDKSKLESLSHEASVCGRVMFKRVMGKASFVSIQDTSGQIQCYLTKEKLGEQKYANTLGLLDVGDIVGVHGTVMRTNKGELTVSASDIVLLNKTDLVGDDGLERVEERIRKINPYTKITRTSRCVAPLDEILGLDAFSLERVLEFEPDFLESDHDHEHDDDVTSISFTSDIPLDFEKFQSWFSELLQTKGQDILRSKGILEFEGIEERYVFQGVHMLMDGSTMGKWPKGAPRKSRLVFIGRNLESMGLEEGFERCRINSL